MHKLRNTIIKVAVFGLAMGYLEAVVVVYLRELYYPGGFTFPLKPISARDALIEIGREAATLIMLVMVGSIAGKNARQRFSFFLLAFGVWDVIYYLFLKLILGWPQRFGVPDILFLIPVPWVGPVWAPIVLSLTMILLATVILSGERSPGAPALSRTLWLLVPGALLVIFSFTKDALQHLSAITSTSEGYEPSHFAAWLFWAGEIIILLGILLAGVRRKDAFL